MVKILFILGTEFLAAFTFHSKLSSFTSYVFAETLDFTLHLHSMAFIIVWKAVETSAVDSTLC